MATARTDSESLGPVTLEELAERGFVVYRSGSRVVRMTVEDEENNPHSFVLPGSHSEESKAESLTWESRIIEYLSKCNGPVSKFRLDKVLNKGGRGGRYGMALAKLTRERRVFCVDGEYSDDPKKFDSSE